MRIISDIDQNFKIQANIQKSDICFYNIKENAFCLYGLQFNDSHFFRFDEAVAQQTSANVADLNRHTSGGVLRFVTDSSYVALICKFPQLGIMPHMPLTGSGGFDLYVGNQFYGSFAPPADAKDQYAGIIELQDTEPKEITMHFPLYNAVSELYIGLQENASFEPLPYENELPVIFYGSSITQGGCVSRPGNAYPAICARRCGLPFQNLGFSGSAKGELAICHYIAAQKMAAFVYDYDYNAPSVEHLARTHEPFFKIIREKQPNLPIILLSAPDIAFAQKKEAAEQRARIIQQTYENAVASGDKHVYFINGKDLWSGEEIGCCTVDGCHPTDLGHFRMAMAVTPVLKRALHLK